MATEIHARDIVIFKYLSFASLVILIALTAAHAAGTSTTQFLKSGAGARAAAMGEAFTSISDDVTATYWNPAGLVQVSSGELSFMQSRWLLDSQYQFLGFAFPAKKNTWGFSLYRLGHGSLDGYSNSDVNTGSFEAESLSGNVSYAQKISNQFYLGFTGKYISESIDSSQANTFAGDIGLILKRKKYQLGLAIQNMGPGLKFVSEKESLPQVFRLGGSRKFLKDKLLAALDLSKPSDNNLSWHTGAEYILNSRLTIRGGYEITPQNQLSVDGLTGFSAGVGFNIAPFAIDYAISPFGDLSTVHRLSFLMRFSAH